MPAEDAVCDRLGADDRLIETLGYRPGEGAVRARLHAARMQNSAAALGFPFDRAAFDRALERIARGPVPLRLRLTLDAGGTVRAEAAPFAPQPDGTVWRVAIARTRLDSRDPLLPHKTTLRTAYDSARAEFAADAVDEALLTNERGEICEGTFTSLFVDAGNGRLRTPPLSSGLLAGVLRQHMLDTGQAVEQILLRSDLSAAHEIFVGNSLRGLIRARLETFRDGAGQIPEG